MDETDFSNRVKGDAPAKQALNKALGEIQSEEFRTVRNKVLAHNDLKTIIGKGASLDIDVIGRAVHYVGSFHASINAVREGSAISYATGKGVIPSPIDLQKCWDEIDVLINRLKESL